MDSPNTLLEESKKLKQLQISYLPDQVLFSEGDKSREMYILLSGKVEISKNEKRIAVVERRGSYLGELSTILGIPRTATVKTIKACEFIVVDGDKVSDFFKCSPVLGLKLARILADRLATMNLEYLKLENRIDRLSAELSEAAEKLKKRDLHIDQLIERIEQLEEAQA